MFCDCSTTQEFQEKKKTNIPERLLFQLDESDCINFNDLIDIDKYKDLEFKEVVPASSKFIKNGLYLQIECNLLNIDSVKDKKLSIWLDQILTLYLPHFEKQKLIFFEFRNLENLRSKESFSFFLRIMKLDQNVTHHYTDYIYEPPYATHLMRINNQVESINGLSFKEYLVLNLKSKNYNTTEEIKNTIGYGAEYTNELGRLHSKYKIEILEDALNLNLVKFKKYQIE